VNPIAITLLLAVALAGFGALAWRKLAIVVKLAPEARWDHPLARLQSVLVNGFLQSRMVAREWKPGTMHAVIFLGFVTLLVRKVQLLVIGYNEAFVYPGLAGGMFAFASLGQDEDPPFTFRAMVVRAYWPGATATQMAEQVTDKLEKKLQETPGIDKIRSYSKPGETLIFVQVNEATRGRDVADAWYQVRKKVGDIRGTLPPNVQGPFFNDEFGDVYGVIFAFSSDGFSYRELKDYVEDARQRLLRVPNVAKIDRLHACFSLCDSLN
jgi:hypothetical protein